MFYYGNTTISIKSPFRFFSDLGSLSVPFSMFVLSFSLLVRYRFLMFFRWCFFRICIGKKNKMLPNRSGECSVGAPLWRPFSEIDFGRHFGHLLLPRARPICSRTSFWLPFGTLWRPFGSLWLDFSTLWAPF